MSADLLFPSAQPCGTGVGAARYWGIEGRRNSNARIYLRVGSGGGDGLDERRGGSEHWRRSKHTKHSEPDGDTRCTSAPSPASDICTSVNAHTFRSDVTDSIAADAFVPHVADSIAADAAKLDCTAGQYDRGASEHNRGTTRHDCRAAEYNHGPAKLDRRAG
jgi:hypothetical protein